MFTELPKIKQTNDCGNSFHTCHLESGDKPCPNNADYVYEVSKHNVSKTHSHFGWRWRTFFQRTFAFMWNTIFWLGVVVPFASKVSFKALLWADPFYPDYEINQVGSLTQIYLVTFLLLRKDYSKSSKLNNMSFRLRWRYDRSEAWTRGCRAGGNEREQ